MKRLRPIINGKECRTIYLGSKRVKEIYLGEKKVFPRTLIQDFTADGQVSYYWNDITLRDAIKYPTGHYGGKIKPSYLSEHKLWGRVDREGTSIYEIGRKLQGLHFLFYYFGGPTNQAGGEMKIGCGDYNNPRRLLEVKYKNIHDSSFTWLHTEVTVLFGGRVIIDTFTIPKNTTTGFRIEGGKLKVVATGVTKEVEFNDGEGFDFAYLSFAEKYGFFRSVSLDYNDV